MKTRQSGSDVDAAKTPAGLGETVLVLLDSTVLIDYLRGRPAVPRVQRLEALGDVACTTAVNVEEVYRGLRPEEADRADTLVRGLVILPLGLREGRRAGEWRQRFASEGRTLPQSDCLIAAAAYSASALLATGNPEDFPMEGIRLEHWPVGS